MRRKIKIDENTHDMFAKTMKKLIGKYDVEYPKCYLLGMNRRKTIVKAVDLDNKDKYKGCTNMIAVSSDVLTKAAIEILIEKLIICGVARIGRHFSTSFALADDLYAVNHTDDHGSEIRNNKWLIISYGRHGVEVHRLVPGRNIKFTYKVVK